MATLGPTATTQDATSFANFATYAGTGTFGIHTALANFGWTQTADPNQITFATATAAPFSGAAYPLTNQPPGGYFINCRGAWVSGGTYAVGDVVNSTVTHSSYYCFLAVSGSATDPSADATHFFVYHYEMWQTNDSVTFSETSQSVSYVSSTQTLTIGTTTNPNRFKAGFVITISGATNLPQINGTWCVASATTTQLTFTIPNTLPSFGSNFSGTDSYSLAYNFQPIVMKLEYWGYTVNFSTAPWVRVSFGNGTDGVGNLTGNVVGSTNCGNADTTSHNNQGFIYLDLVTGVSVGGVQASTIWRCIASGSNGRFGACLFYNRNDTNAANNGALTWLVERAKDNSGNDIDDYYTYIAGCQGIGNSIFGNTNRYWNQRSILKWNPNVFVSTVTVDSTNDLIVWYNNFGGAGSYNFAVATTVFFGGLSFATFLNNQFVLVNANSLALTAAANGSGTSVVYTGTITGGATNAYLNQKVTVSGFTNSANNGTFTCIASTATTITLNNTATANAETHAATITGNFFIASFTHAAYATQPDSGSAYLSISNSVPTPIAGTGQPCQSDPCVCTIERNLSSLQVNGQTPLLPAFPVPGFLGNPMTMLQIVSGGDEPGHDTTFSIVLYGATRTYYFPQGVTSDPFQRIGDPSAGSTLQAYGFAMRWD